MLKNFSSHRDGTCSAGPLMKDNDKLFSKCRIGQREIPPALIEIYGAQASAVKIVAHAGNEFVVQFVSENHY